ncbi:cytochrome P450 71D9-like [Arachis stenosperma]|uniref:cytochrome P450 71D9-like n=1 Tax=Arachis stenosperma TaxID=217475 RepID=UPI0025ABEEF4|nr:cytochrome P450 71D9-like [Arachis stenosperma]
MDSLLFDFPTLFCFFLFMLAALKLWKKKNLNKINSTSNIAPGPWKLPIIGNIHHLATSTPHRKLRDLSKIHGPLMHLQLGEIFTIVVSSAEYAKEVMKTHDIIFASRPQILAAKIISYDCTSIALAPYGNYWRQLKKICTLELFTLKRVDSFQLIREEEFTSLIKRIIAATNNNNGSPVNLTQEVFSTIYTVTSRAAFGMKFKDQERFILLAKELAKVGTGFSLGDLFPSAKWLQLLSGLRPKIEKLHGQTDQILQNIINEYKEAKSSKSKEGQGEVEGLLDVLLRFEDGNGSNQDFSLTSNNIKAIILNIFGAGGGTTATTIDWAMAEMIKDPTIMKKAQVEMRENFNKKGSVDETCLHKLKYLKSVVKETLRLHPPVPLLLPRECRSECDINGYHIPEKSKVIVNAWAIGRDPNYWSEPERFYPERFLDSSIDYRGNNFEYIPFGAGRRMCPGSALGVINVELALAYLLYHFDWKLPSEMRSEELDMTEALGVTVRRKDDLQLVPIAFYPLLEA